MSKQEIIAEIKNKNLPVVICGAGVVGEILLSLLEEEGIEVEFFCDSSTEAIKTKVCGKEVVYTPELKKRYEDAVIIISAAAIKDVVDLLEEKGFNNWYAGGLLLEDVDYYQNQIDSKIDYSKYALETCVLCHNGYLNPDKLFLRSIEMMITERCSLKCKDCSNLMQYYENPQNCDIDMLYRSIDNFFKVFDEVMEFRLLGGDVFMNPQWPLVVEKLIKEPKIKRIVLYTNGTLIPQEKYIDLLKMIM